MSEDDGMTGLQRLPSALLAAACFALSCGSAAAGPDDGNAASRCARAEFKVVLDVGHTAESPGAKSARGVDEYVFNLRLAKVVDQALRDAGFARTVLMVTGGPGVRSMYARVARANALGADLLLSIHHDSVPNRFLEKWEYNGKPETFSDRFKGHSLFVSDDNVDLKDSLLFGGMLGRQLKARGLQYTPHYTESFMGRYQHKLLDAEAGVYRYDTLFVLKKSRMPAVLLEAGSIINRDEELVLETPERQRLIAGAVVAAIDAYCAARPRKPATEIARSSQPRHARKLAHSRRRAPEPAAATAALSGLDIH
jgi:N-acetylmuramoyl-L-alanine amidase